MTTENTIFKLIEIEYCDKKPQYPLFGVSKSTLGYFFSLEKAEQAMKNNIEENDNGRQNTSFGFLIEEYALDVPSYWQAKSRRSYLSDGTLWAENLLDEDPLLESDDPAREFLGRPAEKRRFQKGDLVETLNGTQVTLEIVTEEPDTPEEVSEQRENDKENFLHHDYSDDYYRTINHNGKQSYSNVIYVFPPRIPVGEVLQKKLWKMYQLETEIFLTSKIMGNTFFKLVEMEHRDEKPQYPNFTTVCTFLGFYSNMDKAEQALKSNSIKKDISRKRSLFGFMIEGYFVESPLYWCTKSRFIYTPDGILATSWYY